MLLAIDPGADSGWAVYNTRGSVLEACGLAGAARTRTKLPLEGVTRVLIERPMIYPGGRQEARPRDVITLALRAGERGGAVRAATGVEPEYVEPRPWKGTIAKDTCHARIWARLSPDERAIVDKACVNIAPGLRHNVLDAVGIGLYGVGRFEAGR